MCDFLPVMIVVEKNFQAKKFNFLKINKANFTYKTE